MDIIRDEISTNHIAASVSDPSCRLWGRRNNLIDSLSTAFKYSSARMLVSVILSSFSKADLISSVKLLSLEGFVSRRYTAPCED